MTPSHLHNEEHITLNSRNCLITSCCTAFCPNAGLWYQARKLCRTDYLQNKASNQGQGQTCSRLRSRSKTGHFESKVKATKICPRGVFELEASPQGPHPCLSAISFKPVSRHIARRPSVKTSAVQDLEHSFRTTKYDRLRGSASPVLRRLALSIGKGNFRPHTESTPLSRSPKDLSQVIMSATPMAVPNQVHIRPRGASGYMVEM